MSESKLGPQADCSRFIDAEKSDCCFFCHEEGNEFYFELPEGIVSFHGRALLCQCMASDNGLILEEQVGTGSTFVLPVLHEVRQAFPDPDDPSWDP